jgi:hypothetical protein
MSDLVYQNYNNRCQGWTPPSSLTGPQINGLSGYQSPAGSSTVVSISGVNFFSYSTIHFGTFTPTTYFINSNIIQFYIPNTLSSGTFPVQVFNGSIPSNIVTYTIDNASGYWLLNPGGSISNTNSNGVIIQSPETYGSATLRISDTKSNQQILFSAKSGSGAYNPFTKPNSQEIVAFKNPDGPINTQMLSIVPHSETSCGIRVSGGNGNATNAYCEIGCGGNSQTPSQSIKFDNATSSIGITYTNLKITTTDPLPATSPGAAPAFLPITINGNQYVIPLYLPPS